MKKPTFKRVTAAATLLTVVVAASIGGVATKRWNAEPAPKKSAQQVREERGMRKLARLKAADAKGLPAGDRCGETSRSYPAEPRSAPIDIHGSASFTPETLGQLEDAATVVVYAEVVRVDTKRNARAATLKVPRSAPEHVQKVAEIEQEFAREQVAVMRTCKLYEGEVADTFNLYRLGSAKVQVGDDAPLRVGERYLLYLRERDTGVPADKQYITVSPPGRMFVEADGRVRSLDTGTDVALALNGLPSVADAVAVVEADVAIPEHENGYTDAQIKRWQNMAAAGEPDRVIEEVIDATGH